MKEADTAESRRWPTGGRELEPSAGKLAEVLAMVAHDAEAARALAMRAGFPPADLPELKTAMQFWSEVAEQAAGGRIRLQPLVEEALRQFPANRELREISHQIGTVEVLGAVKQLAVRERRGSRMSAVLAILSIAAVSSVSLSLVWEASTSSSLMLFAAAGAMALALGLLANAVLHHSFRPALRRVAAFIEAQRSNGLDAGPILRTHRSIHHLFGERDRLLPRKQGTTVDLALDAADLPEGLLPYLELLERNGFAARMLLLDPSSPLVSHHRFSAGDGSGTSRAATETTRAKMRKDIALVREHANVRLYDAMPLGNLVIVGDRIFWGGIASVRTDVSMPLIEMTAEMQGQLSWAYRRNFERLWDIAKPADALVQSVQPSTEVVASGAG